MNKVFFKILLVESYSKEKPYVFEHFLGVFLENNKS